MTSRLRLTLIRPGSCWPAAPFPVATLDLGLPPTPDTPQVGLKLLEDLATLAPFTRLIVITGNSEQDTAVKAVASGAVDFCSKPLDLKVLKVVLDRSFKLHALQEAGRQLRLHSDQCDSLCGMIGVAPVMQNLFAMIRKISANDYPVLISGESGTGKEMVAHAIHELGPRCTNPMVIVNCGAIPETCWKANCSAMKGGPSPVRWPENPGNWKSETREPSFWMKSASCLWPCR